MYGTEIYFLYSGRDYWIAYTDDRLPHLNDDLGNTQFFDSCYDLFESVHIDNKTLNGMNMIPMVTQFQ